MDEIEEQSRAGRSRQRGRRRWTVVLVVVVLLVGAAVGYYVFDQLQADQQPTEEAQPDDGGVVELPQNPSLELAETDGVWSVTNDGNVTMSSIEVRDGTEVLCEYETLAPGDSVDCEEVSGASELSVFGEGPQGQEVERAAVE